MEAMLLELVLTGAVETEQVQHWMLGREAALPGEVFAAVRGAASKGLTPVDDHELSAALFETTVLNKIR